MTANVMKKFLKKLPKDIENIIKDNIRDILCLNVKSQKKVINQLKELFFMAEATLCEHYVCEGNDDLDEVYDLLMEKHLKEYIFEELDMIPMNVVRRHAFTPSNFSFSEPLTPKFHLEYAEVIEGVPLDHSCFIGCSCAAMQAFREKYK